MSLFHRLKFSNVCNLMVWTFDIWTLDYLILQFLQFRGFICLQINTAVEYKWKRSKLYGVYVRQVCTVHKPSMYTVQKPGVYAGRCTIVHKLWINQEIFCMYTIQTYPEHTPDIVRKPAEVIFFNKNISIYKTALPLSWNQVSHNGFSFNTLY